MYVSSNPKTKKALKEAVAAGEKLTIFQPGLGTVPTDGTTWVEGPHYPAAHTWAATIEMKDGYIVKVKG